MPERTELNRLGAGNANQHPQRSSAVPSSDRAWPGMALVWIAGFVDAVDFLILSHIYSANMSGNTVGLGRQIAELHWRGMWTRFCPIPAFFIGLMIGAMIVEGAVRLGARRRLATAMVAELLCLAAFYLIADKTLGPRGRIDVGGGALFSVLVSLAAMAMGLQNGALRRVGGLKTVHTYVTGTLLSAAESYTDFLFWFRDRTHAGPQARGQLRFRRTLRVSLRQKCLRRGIFSSMLWVTYLIGAFIGALWLNVWGLAVMLAPMLLLAAVGVMDLLRPLDARAVPRR